MIMAKESENIGIGEKKNASLEKKEEFSNNSEQIKELDILKKQLGKLIFLNKSSVANCVAEIRKLKKIIANEKMKINKILTK